MSTPNDKVAASSVKGNSHPSLAKAMAPGTPAELEPMVNADFASGRFLTAIAIAYSQLHKIETDAPLTSFERAHDVDKTLSAVDAFDLHIETLQQAAKDTAGKSPADIKKRMEGIFDFYKIFEEEEEQEMRERLTRRLSQALPALASEVTQIETLKQTIRHAEEDQSANQEALAKLEKEGFLAQARNFIAGHYQDIEDDAVLNKQYDGIRHEAVAIAYATMKVHEAELRPIYDLRDVLHGDGKKTTSDLSAAVAGFLQGVTSDSPDPQEVARHNRDIMQFSARALRMIREPRDGEEKSMLQQFDELIAPTCESDVKPDTKRMEEIDKEMTELLQTNQSFKGAQRLLGDINASLQKLRKKTVKDEQKIEFQQTLADNLEYVWNDIGRNITIYTDHIKTQMRKVIAEAKENGKCDQLTPEFGNLFMNIEYYQQQFSDSATAMKDFQNTVKEYKTKGPTGSDRMMCDQVLTSIGEAAQICDKMHGQFREVRDAIIKDMQPLEIAYIALKSLDRSLDKITQSSGERDRLFQEAGIGAGQSPA